MKTTMVEFFVCLYVTLMHSHFTHAYTCAGDGEINEEEFYRIMKKTSLFWSQEHPGFSNVLLGEWFLLWKVWRVRVGRALLLWTRTTWPPNLKFLSGTVLCMCIVRELSCSSRYTSLGYFCYMWWKKITPKLMMHKRCCKNEIDFGSPILVQGKTLDFYNTTSFIGACFLWLPKTLVLAASLR